MRVGVDARLVYYQQGGISTYILRLLEALAALGAEDEFVVLASRRQRLSLPAAPNFRLARLWTPPHHPGEQLTLPVELWPLGLDLLHSPDYIPPFRRRCRSVITVHDLAFLIYPQVMTGASHRYYGQLARAVESADLVIAISQNTKRDIMNLLGAPEERLRVIYEAADPRYRPLDGSWARGEVERRYGLEGDYALFVGTIEPRKNLPLLLRAWDLLRREGGRLPGAKLALAGRRGWLCDDVFRLAEKVQGVVFLGGVSQPELLHLYNAARVLVYPSLYEGFGLPPLEAMACGTPVITSAVSSLPEVVGEAGILVNPHDAPGLAEAIHRVFSDDSLHAELSRRGLARAAGFSWRRAAEETLAAYREAVG